MSACLLPKYKRKKNIGEVLKKDNTEHTAGSNVGDLGQYGKRSRDSSNTKFESPYNPTIPVLSIYPKDLKSVCERTSSFKSSFGYYLQSPHFEIILVSIFMIHG